MLPCDFLRILIKAKEPCPYSNCPHHLFSVKLHLNPKKIKRDAPIARDLLNCLLLLDGTYSLGEIGEAWGFSRERIRQIEETGRIKMGQKFITGIGKNLSEEEKKPFYEKREKWADYWFSQRRQLNRAYKQKKRKEERHDKSVSKTQGVRKRDNGRNSGISQDPENLPLEELGRADVRNRGE
jgi:hypothetical protein